MSAFENYYRISVIDLQISERMLNSRYRKMIYIMKIHSSMSQQEIFVSEVTIWHKICVASNLNFMNTSF